MLKLPGTPSPVAVPPSQRRRRPLAYGVVAGVLVLLLAVSTGVALLWQANHAMAAKVNSLEVDLESARAQLDRLRADQGGGLTDEQIKSSLNDEAVSTGLLAQRVDHLEKAVGGLSGDGSSLSQRISTLESSVGFGSDIESRLSTIESDTGALNSRLGAAEKTQRLTDANVDSVAGNLRSLCQTLRSGYGIYVYC